MEIKGLSDWQKRRLALVLRERGQTAFIVIKHAQAAILCTNRERPINEVDECYLALLDATIKELYGLTRSTNELSYMEPLSLDESGQSY